MFIVLEGCDLAGKSTLVDDLAANLPGETMIHHSGQLKEDPIHAYALPFEKYVPGGEQNVICDRLHLGEAIYGPLYRGESKLTKASFRWIEMYLASLGAVAVHVTQSADVIRERMIARGEDFLQTEHVETVLSGFDHVFEETSLAPTQIDEFPSLAVRPEQITVTAMTVRPGFDGDIVRRIYEAAEYRDNQAAEIFKRWPSYIGRSMVRTLLVGDERGGTPPHETTRPFMASSTSSGSFLLEEFDRHWWKEVGIINATDCPDIEELCWALGEPYVVALGKNAHKELDKQGIVHAGVPHPQYVRRFAHDKQREYAALIQTIAPTETQRFSWPN